MVPPPAVHTPLHRCRPSNVLLVHAVLTLAAKYAVWHDPRISQPQSFIVKIQQLPAYMQVYMVVCQIHSYVVSTNYKVDITRHHKGLQGTAGAGQKGRCPVTVYRLGSVMTHSTGGRLCLTSVLQQPCSA